MSYGELYRFCQSLPIPISRNVIIGKIQEIANPGPVKIIRSGLNTALIRGFFINARNEDSPFVRTCGTHVIVSARDNNRCWERFVVVKEMMHLLDAPLTFVNNGADFEVLLTDFSSPPVASEWSAGTTSDVHGFWMALGVLCPEESRIEFLKKRELGEITDAQIAGQLLIPEQYVPRLFLNNFKTIMTYLVR